MARKELIKKVLVEISRILLGITFIFSGFVKAIDPLGTTYKVEDYIIAFGADIFYPLSFVIALALLVTEFSVGVFMLLGIYRKWNSRIMLVIMVFMTILTLYLAIANPVSDCGCFGDAIKITNWQTFYKNIVLLAAVIIVFFWYEKITNLYTGKFYWMVALFTIIFAILFSLYNYYTEPIIDFRPYKVGADLPKLIDVEEGKGDVYENIFIYEKGGEKKEFTEDNYPWNDTTWTFVDRINKLVKEGEKPAIDDFAINRLYFNPDKTDFEGDEDITTEVLENEDYVFLMISYSLFEMDETYLSRFEDVNNYAKDHDYDFYCLTSSTRDDIIKWEKENADNFKFCLTDERTLKTIMRSNPGLVLLKNGVIINKWTGACVPAEEDLTKPLNELPYGHPVDSKAQEDRSLAIIAFLFVVPLLILKILDFLIYRKKQLPRAK